MKTTRTHNHADRYHYDFGDCRGWPQIDTGQDAWYFGQWCHPTKLVIICYAEGDVTITQCTTPEEFILQLLEIKAWTEEHDHWKGIDPLCNAEHIAAFEALGIDFLCH